MKKLTTAQAITQATEKLTGDINSLQTKRDQSLSIFRQTAQNLTSINEELQTAINNMDELSAFIAGQRGMAEKAIADNAHVCDKIYEIIGK